MTEQEMRETEVLAPQSLTELSAYVDSLVNMPHDYGTCVYAMSMAAEAAFRYVAHQLGVTGFQASCADLDFLKRVRGLKGPFAIIDANDMLYPQYNIQNKVAGWMEEWKPWAREEAKKKLADPLNSQAHPNVKARWEELAGLDKPE